jgi:hypothetical protein
MRKHSRADGGLGARTFVGAGLAIRINDWIDALHDVLFVSIRREAHAVTSAKSASSDLSLLRA